MTYYDQLREAGFNASLARALDQSDIQVEKAKLMSEFELMDCLLTWEGIHGYTGIVIASVDNIRTMLLVTKSEREEALRS